jgi:cation diffusion facilitator CzcD-associated flavoprotein CzcO
MLEAGSWDLTLFEKNAVPGGTWVENTYPGVACDVSWARPDEILDISDRI